MTSAVQGYAQKKPCGRHGDIFFWLCPPIVQSSGHFKTTHKGCYPSAKAYGAACDELSRVVRRFETILYRALFRGQSKKRYLHALFYLKFHRDPWDL
jgi:hypothetical protein